MEFKKIHEEFNILLSFSAGIKVQQTQREQMVIMSFLTDLHTNLRLLNLKFYLVSRSQLFEKFSVECYIQRLLHLINILMFLLPEEEEEIIPGEGTEQWIVRIVIEAILFVITVMSKDT